MGDNDWPFEWGEDYDPFEEDRDLIPFYGGDEEYRNVLRDIGIFDLNELIVNQDEASADGVRGQRFSTPEEAAAWLYDTGLLYFSRIVRYGAIDDDGNPFYEYGVDVGDTGAQTI